MRCALALKIDLSRLPQPELVPFSVATVLERLAEFSEVRFILVFGSRALGDADERSDVDVSISAPAISRRRWLDMKQIADEGRTLLRITLIHFESSPPALQRRNLSDGVIVYESTQAAR